MRYKLTTTAVFIVNIYAVLLYSLIHSFQAHISITPTVIQLWNCPTLVFFRVVTDFSQLLLID